jgi:hypothetical protein
VLGFYGRFGGAPECSVADSLGGSVGDPDMPSSVTCVEQASPGAIPLESSVQRAGSAVLPLPVFRDKAPLGFINVAPDGDGIVRKAPLLIRAGTGTQGALYPSLPCAP